MTFESVALNVAGPSYEARSVPISAQRTVNFYPERNKGGLSEFILMPWPGLKSFSTGSGIDRGQHVFNNLTYKVSGITLYEIDAAGTQTAIGTIAGSRFCSFADNGTTMVICNGSTPYSFTGSTQLTSLTAITFNPKVVTYLNKQFIFDGDDGNFSVSDPGTTTINALNNAEPESAPDALVAPFVYNQILYLFGKKTIEPWDNTGTGNPPFERIDGGILEDVGTLSPYGITSTPNAIYFIAFDGVAHRMVGFRAESISNPAVSRLFQSYTLDTVKAFTITFDGQPFCVFVFDEATWAFSETLSEWFELDDRGARWLGTSCVSNYGKRLIGDAGNVHELDFDTFTNNGNFIGRERILQVIAGETFGSPRQRIEMSKLRISLEAGVGATTGQGADPILIVQPSYDGGKAYGKEYWLRTGRLGEHETDVEWHHMAQFKQLAIKLRMTDPIKWVLAAASIDLREAGY